METKAYFITCISALIIGTLLIAIPSTTYESSISFVTGVLPPPPPGSTTIYNQAAEPQIASDGFGNFYIVSENGLGAGTDAWKSTNNGVSYFSLPQPNAISSAGISSTTGFAPGGGDVAIAIASKPNTPYTNAQYNIYVASLTLASVTVSVSQDGGMTWQSNVLSATIPVDDRPWIAAYGSNIYYLSYHNIATGFQIIINEGTVINGMPVTVQTYQAINPAQTNIYLGTIADNELGNIAVDQKNGIVYQIFAGCPPSATAIVTCSNFNTLYIAVGVPVGINIAGQPILNFTDYIIYQSPNATVSLANNFPVVAVDNAGNVYAVWSDDQNVYLSYSRDFGRTWSVPQQVNSPPAVTAIYPWIAVGNPGQVDIVYYGTPASANFQTCTPGTPGPYDCQNEPWYVFFAQNLNVFKGGKWTQIQVTSVVHYGGICQGGISCMSNGNDNRDLYDDFGVTISPTTGLASIAYTDDQYSDIVGTANQGLCSPSQSNTVACDHTDFATQVSGTGVFQKTKGIGIIHPVIGPMSLSNPQPTLALGIINNEGSYLTQVSIQLNGLTLSMNWNSTLPLASNQTIYGESILDQIELQLILGNVYLLNVTSTFSDGTVICESFYVIYTAIPVS